MSDEIAAKMVVSVTEMARLVGLSRARLYQLTKKGTFPSPDVDATTGRPYYSTAKQQICLEVRRKNCGIDGKPILFYARRSDLGSKKGSTRPTKPQSKGNQYADILDGLRGLGMASVTASQIDPLVKELYPQGLDGTDRGQVIRAVFLRLRRQDSSDKQGR